MPEKKKNEKFSPLADSLFGKKQKTGRVVDWTEVDRTTMGDLVAVASTVGCAVLFGFTRDRGAWALTFMCDILPKNDAGRHIATEYCNSEEMLQSWLEEWIDNWSRIAQEAQEGR